jgi:hypothetical protein
MRKGTTLRRIAAIAAAPLLAACASTTLLPSTQVDVKARWASFD